MSAQPEALNFGTGPVEGELKHRVVTVLDPRKDTFSPIKLAAAVTAEFICTALFVFYCAATVVGSSYLHSDQTLIPAFGQGFALALLIYIAAPASGGHLNPAVTISVLCVGRIGLVRAVLYVIAQYAGATVGAGLVKAFVRNQFEAGLGSTMINPDITNTGAFFFEFIMTFLLVFVMFGTAIDPRGVGKLAPLAIGMVVLCDNLIGGHWTGASMNPARTFGPAVISDNFDHYWLYFFAPTAGALLAAILYELYLMVDPINEAVDQNNNIIRIREAVKNTDKAPLEYQPAYRRRLHKLFRRPSKSSLPKYPTVRQPNLTQSGPSVKRSESLPMEAMKPISRSGSAPVS